MSRKFVKVLENKSLEIVIAEFKIEEVDKIYLHLYSHAVKVSFMAS